MSRYSDREKKRRRRIAGVATVGVLAAGAVLFTPKGNQSSPPDQQQKITDPTLLADINAHKERMTKDLAGMPEDRISEYFLSEIDKAVSVRVRGLMEEGAGELYSDLDPRLEAIYQHLKELPQRFRTAIVTRMNGRFNLVHEKQHGYEEVIEEIFASSFDDPAKAREVLAKVREQDPEHFTEQLHLEIDAALEDMCNRLPISDRNRKNSRELP